MWLPIRHWTARLVKCRAGQQVSRVRSDPGDDLSATAVLNQVSKYKIKLGYVERESPAYFEDVPDGIVYQPDVYSLAGLLASSRLTILSISAADPPRS
jgi:hypothetical protein